MLETNEDPTHTFDYFGEELRYAYHLYNLTYLHERKVELAVAWHWMKRNTRGVGLEVGNVLGHYRPVTHRVVDKFERRAWYQTNISVDNVDLFDLTPKRDAVDWLVSISTIEHVGTDFPSNHTGLEALNHLRSLLKPGGRMLVTFPTGINPSLDEAVANETTGATRCATFVKHGKEMWTRPETPVIQPYGEVDEWAGAVFIGEFGPL